VGSTVDSWLVRSSPDRAVRVRAMSGDIVCVLGEDIYSHSASPLSTQVYKWVPLHLMLGPAMY